MVTVAVAVLAGDKIILRKATRLSAQRRLQFPGIEAAVGQPAINVVPALTRPDIDVAADIVQAVTRIVGSADNLDVVDIQRKDHVQVAHVAAVDVGRDTVDQQLDTVDIALAVESPEGGLAGFSAEPEFGQLDSRHLADQLPAVGDVLVADPFGPHDVD